MKNRKKMAGTIAMIMALSLGYNAGGPVDLMFDFHFLLEQMQI